MVKRILSIVLAVSFGLSTGAALPVHAQAQAQAPNPDAAVRDPEKLRVYYSESIGAGQTVYRLTACEKVAAYAPLTCTKELVDGPSGAKYKNQCENKGKVNEGANIKGCYTQQDKENLPPLDNTPYKLIDPKTYDDAACTQNAENHEFVMGRKYAVLHAEAKQDGEQLPPSQKDIIGTVVVEIDGTVPSDASLRTQFGLADDAPVYTAPMFEVSQCSTADRLDGGSQDGTVSGPEAAVAMIGKYKGEFDTLIANGCNNDSGASSFEQTETSGAINKSTPLDANPILSCTTSERIDGVSGTDLLARYVGAIYRWAAGVMGIIAVAIIVASGVQMSMAGGEQGNVDKAKERIKQSLMGLVLLFLSALILYTINPTFFAA